MNFTAYESIGFFDEMIGADGMPRAAARPLAKDIETLIDRIQIQVETQFGVKLQTEVCRVGEQS